MKDHNPIRLAAHGSAWFPDQAQVLSLMRLQCSATRRAMGIKERQTFVVKKADKPNKDGKIPWNLEGRRGSCMLSEKAWSWLENCFLKPKSSSLTGTRLDVGSRPTIGRSVVQSTGESIPTTGRDGCGNALGDERLPCKSGDVRFLQIC